MGKSIKLSVILPVHNEADIIESVVEKINNTLITLTTTYEIILVENGSTDNSWSICHKLITQNRHIRAQRSSVGYGAAVLKGLNSAQGEYVCYMPSDGQIELNVFPDLWSQIQSGQYELVKIKRSTRESWIRSFVSFSFSQLMRAMFHTYNIDINGSPRIFRKDALATLQLSATDSFIDAQFAIRMHQLSWRVKEIPMPTLLRAGGSSTRSWKTFAEFFANIITYKRNALQNNLLH